jgi:hypothetical protein
LDTASSIRAVPKIIDSCNLLFIFRTTLEFAYETEF